MYIQRIFRDVCGYFVTVVKYQDDNIVELNCCPYEIVLEQCVRHVGVSL